MVQEEREREDSSEHQSEDADDEQELSKAASVIQMKYRQRLERRSRGDITLDNGNLSGKLARHDSSSKTGCSSPTSDDSGISPVPAPDTIVSAL